MDAEHEKTILVVDDEPDVREFLATALRDAGFNVVTAGNGLEAYNQVKQHNPDLITLDLVMPRQSGVLFYRRLRSNAKWQRLPVLILTAHAQDDLGQEDFDELMRGRDVPKPSGYLEKPVRPAVLVQTVREALGMSVEETEAPSAAEARSELVEQLRTADLETLRKVQELLERRK
jgi:two-component system alkaline phosphatase synthesis response regulator PhoP